MLSPSWNSLKQYAKKQDSSSPALYGNVALRLNAPWREAHHLHLN
jgi:hypothetical protein